MERVVQLTYLDRVYTFRVEPDPPLAFWGIDAEGLPTYHAPVRVTGDEQPGFFESLAKVMMNRGDVSR